MEAVTTKRLNLFAGRHNTELADEVAKNLGIEVTEAHLSQFANGETHCRFSESIRGADVFIMQSHGNLDGRSLNDAVMEHLIMVDAARRASASGSPRSCLLRLCPTRPKSEGREPITARLMADLFAAAGASRLVAIDLHSGQIQGFFNGPVDHLVAMPILISRLKTESDNLVVVLPGCRSSQGGRALRAAASCRSCHRAQTPSEGREKRGRSQGHRR